MILKMSERPTIAAPTPEEDAEIVAAALADPDARPLTDVQLAAMTPMSVFRGRPRAEGKKILLSVRYSPEVIAYFKSTGAGWQSRMDAVLREYVAQRSR